MSTSDLISRGVRNLVYVVHAVKFRGLAAHVTQLNREIVGDGALHIQVPVDDVRRAEIPVHTEDVARAVDCAVRRRGKTGPATDQLRSEIFTEAAMILPPFRPTEGAPVGTELNPKWKRC